jgi:hypothetical protein
MVLKKNVQDEVYQKPTVSFIDDDVGIPEYITHMVSDDKKKIQKQI